MDDYYDHVAGVRVTNRDPYERVLAEPRFEAIRDADILLWSPERAWALVLELLAAVPEDTVSDVGAGPLEDLVVKHSAALVDAIEAELPRNPRLQAAVIEINLQRDHLPSPIEARLVAAFGPRFVLLDRTG